MLDQTESGSWGSGRDFWVLSLFFQNPRLPEGVLICHPLGAYVSLRILSWGFLTLHVASQLSFPEACSSWLKRRELLFVSAFGGQVMNTNRRLKSIIVIILI